MLGGDVGLTVVVVSPRHDGPVGLETQTVGTTRGDGHETAVGRERWFDRRSSIPNATMDPSVLRPRLCCTPAATATKPVLGGDVGLTVAVVSPRHDGPVGLETQTVVLAPGDGH